MKALLFLLLVPGVALAADSPGFHLRGDAEYVHPRDSENGFELGLGAFAAPVAESGAELGPRIAYQKTNRTGEARHSWILGAQAEVWIFNVTAPGLEVDWMTDAHYRIEPFFDLRLMHLGAEGALAIRVGGPYEQQLGWGFLAGITLQLNGASSAAERSNGLLAD